MLEVKNLTFKVNENGIERSIVKDIKASKLARARCLLLPDPMAEASLLLQRH